MKARTKISDLISQLGLRAPYTKRRDHWKASAGAPVHDLWEKDITALCKAHYLKTNEEIQTSPEIEQASSTLFDQYAEAIWCRQRHRPWLFDPGQGSASAPYQAHLYYDDPDDREYIKATLIKLVLEKILRYHKDHFTRADRSSGPDADWTPGPMQPDDTPEAHGVSRSRESSDRLQCFVGASAPAAHTKFSPTTGSADDAAWLKEMGVWLGDYDDEYKAVNGASYYDIQRDHFDVTVGGTQHSDEPSVLWGDLSEKEMDLQCASCKLLHGDGGGGAIRIECHEFGFEDKPTNTNVEAGVWLFPCKLEGRTVFAIVRQEKRDPYTWSFWKLEGGYTKSILLTTLGTQFAAPSTGLKRKRADMLDALPDRTASSITSNKRPTPDRPTPTAFSKRAPGSSGQGSSIGSGALFVTPAPADDRERTIPSVPHRGGEARGESEMSWNSLYDATPLPERQPTHRGGQVKGTAVPTREAAQRSAPQADIMDPPSFTLRFRARIAVDGYPGQNIVALNDSMNVRAVFTAAQAKLQRKLQGRPIAALSFSGRPGEQITDVEIDDEEGWACVLEMVKADGVVDLYGSVTVAEGE